MEQLHLLNFVSDHAPVLIFVTVIYSAVCLVGRVFGGIASIPLIGGEYGNFEQRRKAYVAGATRFYLQGYQKFKDKMFRVTTSDGDHVVVPLKALDELRRYPDDVINIQKALNKLVETDYTGTGIDPNFGIHLVRADLTRNLPRLNARLAAEVEKTVSEELGRCDDWTPFVVYRGLLRIVAIVSGNIFVGPELCRNEEWIDSSINFTVDFFAAVTKLKEWNDWVRPIGQYFTPELKKIDEHRERAKRLMVPFIKERKRLMERGEKEPDDMLQWMLRKAREFDFKDEHLAEVQLGFGLAAIHTTTMSATHILYDLMIHPEIIKDIRAEVKRVLAKYDGKMTSSALFHMKLLDSVMRESARVNTFNDVRFFRHVEKPVTLSDGTQLPAGCDIEAAHVAIVRDPTIYPDPEKFDPWRFYNLRNGSVPDPLNYHTTEKYQYVSVTKEYMNFGYGRHACPGRFFAGNEIKMILARLFLDYDIRMPEGCTGRYPDYKSGSNMMPNTEGVIELRRVKAETETETLANGS